MLHVMHLTMTEVTEPLELENGPTLAAGMAVATPPCTPGPWHIERMLQASDAPARAAMGRPQRQHPEAAASALPADVWQL